MELGSEIPYYMMNANSLDCFQSHTGMGTATDRRGKKALQMVLPEPTFSIAGMALTQLTRKQALVKVKRWLKKPTVTPVIERNAKRLMYLFMIEAEELLEAGVSYENVCALQRHWLI